MQREGGDVLCGKAFAAMWVFPHLLYINFCMCTLGTEVMSH